MNVMSTKKRATTVTRVIVSRIAITVVALVMCMAGRAGAQNVEGAPEAPQKVSAVVSSNPSPGEINVPVNRTVLATFNLPMKCQTITTLTFKLFALPKTSDRVVGMVACAGTSATFTPSENLAFATTYLVKL